MQGFMLTCTSTGETELVCFTLAEIFTYTGMYTLKLNFSSVYIKTETDKPAVTFPSDACDGYRKQLQPCTKYTQPSLCTQKAICFHHTAFIYDIWQTPYTDRRTKELLSLNISMNILTLVQ